MSRPTRFENHWSKQFNFIDLGTADYDVVGGGESRTIYRDLYAITHHERDAPFIDFGCRFSDTDHDYASGSAIQANDSDRWIITGPDSIALAAARYFANHYARRVKF